MKNILKLLLLLFFVVVFSPSVFAEKIDTEKLNFRDMDFSETQNPVTYNYILDYANMLYDKINTTIPFREDWGLEYRYKLHTDGTISDLKPMPLNIPYKGKPINKLFEDFITNATPPPFPENMEIGDVFIELCVDTFVVEKTTIRFLRRNDGAPTPGNYISIHIPVKNYQKFFKFYR